MRIVRLLIMGIVVLLVSTSLPAQPTTAPAEDRVLPELRFDNVSLDDITDFLRDVSGVNIVVRRALGVPPDYPALGKIHLSNITTRQFLAFLNRTYDLPVERIEGPSGAMYSIKIDVSSIPSSARQLLNPQVRVFDLSEAINGIRIRRPADAKGDPLADTMSLLQAVLDQSGEQPKPILTVHQATQTLIFKGSPRSADLIENTLVALRSGRNSSDSLRALGTIRDAFGSNDSVDAQMFRDQLKDQRSRMNQLESENVQLRSELEKLSKTPSTK